MARIILALLAKILFFGSTASAQQNEESCKKMVGATISVIEMEEQQTGEEKSLNDLTKKDIEEMLKTKTYCDVWKEINKHTHR